MTEPAMTQPSLFDAGVRVSDPVTSQQAAQSLTQPTLSAQRKQVLREVALLAPLTLVGRTSFEIHTWTGIQQSVVSRRCTDLARLGLIKDSGRTRRGSSNRELTVWVITDQGREAISDA